MNSLAIALVALIPAFADDALKPFQGTWVIADALLAGRDHKEDFAAMNLTITGDKYVVDFGLKSDAGTITLKTEHTPKWIDLTTKADGPFMGRVLPGIYEFKDGKLIICSNSEKPDRPEKFEAPVKTPLMLLTFERDKK